VRRLAILFLAAFAAGCGLDEKPEQIPGYVQINDISVTTTSEQGSSSDNISDAWVYVNDPEFGYILQGVYEMPASFPVLIDGETEFQIRGGARISGLSSVRQLYPFYRSYYDTVQLTPDGNVELTPVLDYFPGVTFDWMEDAEDPGLSMEPTESSDTILTRITGSEAFEGNASLAFYLDTANPLFFGVTVEEFNLPKGGRPVFLEIDYKCNYEWIVGVLGNTPNGVTDFIALTILAKEDWNKLYIQLTNQVSAAGNINATSFKIYFASLLNPDAQEEAFVYIDNVKLVY
jgi:hypothetical protein